MKKTMLLIILLSGFLTQCQKTTEFTAENNITYKAETVIDGIEIAWGMVFLPDGSILYSEQDGRLIRFKDGVKNTVEDAPEVVYVNQGGLLDLELHPDYDKNGWIYISYSGNLKKEEEGSHTIIMRAQLKDDRLVNKEIIYEGAPYSKKGHHYGSRIEFDRSGYLYFSIGDRGARTENPQDLKRDGGKIYRLNDDGTIPTDNPFVNEEGARKATYSYGHRNPQGMAMNPLSGKIWVHEHGPKGGDEINIIDAGKNYGWPVITYGKNYDDTVITNDTSKPGMEQPFHHWTPSIAPSGMTFITSDVYPGWENKLLVGSLKFKYLNLVSFDDSGVVKEEKLMDGLGRMRTVKIGPDGYIYASVEQVGIIKLVAVTN